MALQCSQLCLPTSLRCDLTPRKAPLFRRLQCANTLQNSNIAIQVRFSRHCKKDLTRNVRQWRRRNVCVRAVRKDPKPTYVEMIPIKGEDQFNEVLGSGSPIIIDWMATWCRKCIYLKPKLEKLAAEYHPDVKFYCVDVNAVPSTLVSRAEVTKMPTIQLWKNNEKKAEVIGGDQAWLVMDKIREMLVHKR